MIPPAVPRGLQLLFFCFALPALAQVERTVLLLRLPPNVGFVAADFGEEHAEIKLTANALAEGVLPPPGSSLRLADQSCVVRVPLARGAAAGVRTTIATGGAVIIELTTLGDQPSATAPAGVATSATSPASAAVARTTENRPATLTPPSIHDSLRPAGSGVGASGLGGSALVAAPRLPAPVSSREATGILGELFPDAGPIGFDPVAKADYAVPASTAAVAIGSAASLVRAASPREVVTSVLSDFDREGRLQAGFSFAVTPYTLLRKLPLTAEEYQKSYDRRFWANLQVSLAARLDDSMVTNGAKAARFSTGVSVVFFDQGDLRRKNEVLARITGVLARRFTDADVLNRTLAEPIPDSQIAAARTIWDEARARYWNAASAGMGIAPAYLSVNGKLSDLQGDGVMVWGSVATPGPGALADSMQLIVGGNARLKQRTNAAGRWTRSDVVDAGAQLRFGAASYNVFAEGQYRRRSPDHATATEKFVYEIGVERRITQGVWLNLSWTNDDAVDGGKTLRSGLRYGFGDKAVLASPAR